MKKIALTIFMFNTISAFSQADKVIVKFGQPKLRFTMELNGGFIANYDSTKHYAEILLINPNTFSNGALWTYNKKFHNLREMISTQNKDTLLIQTSKVKKIVINDMEAYLFKGKEIDFEGQSIISYRIIINRVEFDEFYLVYLSAKTKSDIKPLLEIVKSLKKIE
jgi:hypothetical protein